jgi:hypothetical protein
MKGLKFILMIGAGVAAWHFYNNSPEAPQSEAARLLAEAEARRATQQADATARAAIVAELKQKADAQAAAEERSRNTSMAEDDLAMAKERLRSWREKTNPRQ